MGFPNPGPTAIHQGPGRLWLGVPIPASGARLVLDTSGNPAQGAGVLAWLAATVYAKGALVKDTNSNTWIALVGGTSAAVTSPFPGTSPTEGAAPLVDGTSTPPLVWAFCGGAYGGYYAGATTGAKTLSLAPKNEEVFADEVASAIDVLQIGEAYEFSATMMQSELGNLFQFFPPGVFSVGTDSTQPAGLQTYEEISFGGIIPVPQIGVAVTSPRRDAAGKNVVSQLYNAWQMEAIKLPIEKAKPTEFKIAFKGLAVSSRVAGDQVGQIWRQT